MQTHHAVLTLNTHPLHLITFDTSTFSDSDLLWLPHHRQLHNSGRKRKAEHLAGRIAAVHALREHQLQSVPGIGESGEPLWPGGRYGSISHCANHALAVVGQAPVGVDLETLLTPELCNDLTQSIITPDEHATLTRSGLPFPLALTLAFSAKESLYKTFSAAALPFPGFDSARVIALNSAAITLQIDAAFSRQLAGKCVDIAWMRHENQVVTLLALPASGS